MKKGIRKLLLLSILAVFLCGCTSVEDNRDESVDAKEEKIQIGMSFDSFVIERWQRDRDVFVSMAKELGAEVNVQNANGDLEEQIKQIDYFIKKDMDAKGEIVVMPEVIKQEIGDKTYFETGMLESEESSKKGNDFSDVHEIHAHHRWGDLLFHK